MVWLYYGHVHVFNERQLDKTKDSYPQHKQDTRLVLSTMCSFMEYKINGSLMKYVVELVGIAIIHTFCIHGTATITPRSPE